MFPVSIARCILIVNVSVKRLEDAFSVGFKQPTGNFCALYMPHGGNCYGMKKL